MASDDDDSTDSSSSYQSSDSNTGSSTDDDEKDESASSSSDNSSARKRSKSSNSSASSHSSSKSNKSNSHHHSSEEDETVLFQQSSAGDTTTKIKQTKKSAQPSAQPDKLDTAFKKNASSNRVLLKLLQVNDNYTISDPSDEGADKYTLIDFREFDELKKGSACLLRRMGGNPTGKDVELERQRMADLKSTIKVEAQSTIKALMLEEARRVWSKNGKAEPKNFDEIRKMWSRDCSIQSAEATWQVLYGLFDRLESSNNRVRLSWDKRLEMMIMNSLSVAYLRSSVPEGNPKGGPKPTGCVQKLVNQVKQDTVKLIQRAGLASHGHSLVLRMPDFAIKRGEREGHRQHGTMEYYMFYCKDTESFPVLESKGKKGASPKSSSDDEGGAILLKPKSADLEENLRRRIMEQDQLIARLQKNEKTTNSKLQKSLGILSVHGSQRSADQLDDDVDVANQKIKDSRLKLKKAKSKETDRDKLKKKRKRLDADKSKKKRKRPDADKSKKKRKKADADKPKKKRKTIKPPKPPLVFKPKTWSKGAHPKRPSPIKGPKATDTAAKATDTAAKATDTAAKATDTAAKATDTAAKATDIAAKATDSMAAKATDTAVKAMDTAAKATDTAAKATKESPRKGSPRKKQVPVPIELEEGELNDDMDFGECQGEVGTKVLGSKVVDGQLMVYLEWDDDPKLVTLEPIWAVWQDFKSIFKDIEGPPRLRKWLDGRQTRKKSKTQLAVAKVVLLGDEDHDADAVPAEVVDLLKAACSHEDITSLVREENAAYCGEYCYLHGGHCSEEGCTKEFVDKLNPDSKNEARPCNAKPAMVCPNFQREACSFVLCFECYSKKLDSVGRTRRLHKT